MQMLASILLDLTLGLVVCVPWLLLGSYPVTGLILGVLVLVVFIGIGVWRIK